MEQGRREGGGGRAAARSLSRPEWPTGREAGPLHGSDLHRASQRVPHVPDRCDRRRDKRAEQLQAAGPAACTPAIFNHGAPSGRFTTAARVAEEVRDRRAARGGRCQVPALADCVRRPARKGQEHARQPDCLAVELGAITGGKMSLVSKVPPHRRRATVRNGRWRQQRPCSLPAWRRPPASGSEDSQTSGCAFDRQCSRAPAPAL